MKPLTLIVLLFSPLLLFGQIMNGDFDEWRPAFGGTEILPKHYWVNPDIKRGMAERVEYYEGRRNILKLNPDKGDGVTGIDFCQSVDLTSLSVREKGSVQIIVKVDAPNKVPTLTLHNENDLHESNKISYSTQKVNWTTNGFEDIKIGDIPSNADSLYFCFGIRCNYSKRECINETTTVWIDRIYIKPKEPVKKPAPIILKSGKGYRAKYSLEEDYEYSIYSMDGKYMKGGELSMEHELTVSPQGIYILILRNTKTQEYHTYKLVFLE